MAGLSVQLKAPNGREYTQPIGLFINNEFVASKSGAKIASINPTLVIRVNSYSLAIPNGNSDESEITSVYAAGAEDVDLAVKAARKALKDPSWKDLPPTERGYLMNKLADLVEKHQETLATIETWDNGMMPHQ